MSNPYEGEGINSQLALDSCCICMEDFYEATPESGRAVDHELGVDPESTYGIMVVLPCKSHFFHEVCIS